MTASALQSLPDFVDLEFARRLEAAEMIFPDCVESLHRYSPSDPIAAEHVARGIAFFGGVTYPANQCVGMGLHGEVTAADIDRVEDFFRSRGVASTIVVSPLAHESLRALLGQRGYAIAEFNSVLIRRIRAEEPFAVPPGIVIERVTPETVQSWMSVIAEGFAQDIKVAEDVFGGFAALPGALAFLARIEDKVVGGCGGRVIPEARIAALFGTATLPPFRRRGVQTALIARRLHEAAKADCEYAVVSTHPGSGSQRNMERRGFRLAYTKTVMMREWPQEPASGKG
ncbi:MAG TPA: GNAT family N-acetyltransferase [Candidatus Bathyarchaeia archaeon]|nr:GNAT family N-acetyltransferase [Candidatus Bathyarchaeia archaeon]